jgi:SlyX protein
MKLDGLNADIVELQSQMAFQESTLETLNEAMVAQQREILVLRRQLELLKQWQEEQAPAGDQAGDGPVDERPPHY